MTTSILATIEQHNPHLREALEVSSLAMRFTRERLVKYGSRLNSVHTEALVSMTNGLVMQMYGATAKDWAQFKGCDDYEAFELTTFFTAGRRVYPMPCGTGKSQTIISVICAVMQLESEGKLSFHPSLAIASYQVEANIKLLRQVRTELSAMGLDEPANLMGVSHSKSYDQERAERFVKSGYLDYSALKGVMTLSPGTPGKKGKPPITKAYDLASMPATPIDELSDKRFIFISHNRIKSPRQRSEFTEKYYTYRGADRSLLIWDEVLLPSRHWYVSTEALILAEHELSYLALASRLRNPNRSMVLEFVREVRKKWEAALRRVSAEKTVATFFMPEMSIDIERAFAQAKTNLKPESKARVSLADCLIDLAGQTVRLTVATEAGDNVDGLVDAIDNGKEREGNYRHIGLMTAKELVPPALANIAILDASHPVSKLLEKNTDIKGEKFFAIQYDGTWRSSFKTYARLNVYWHNNTSAESSMRDLFTYNADRNNQAKHIRHEIPRLISSFAPDDNVLIATFKDKGGSTSIVKTIQADLKDAGIDIYSKSTDGEHNRINFLTWGQHTSQSELSFCNKLIVVGVQHKPVTAMYCDWIAQAGDELWDSVTLEGSTPQRIVTGEVVSDLYQLINRCACRNTEDGEAGPTDAYIQFSDHDNLSIVKDELRVLMPEMVNHSWEFEDTTKFVSQQDRLAVAIAEYLRALPESVKKISSSKVKKSMGLGTDEESKKMFTRASDNLPDSCEWVRQQRSFIFDPELASRLHLEEMNRIDADYFGDTLL